MNLGCGLAAGTERQEPADRNHEKAELQLAR
jgi:hypothetical protein